MVTYIIPIITYLITLHHAYSESRVLIIEIFSGGLELISRPRTLLWRHKNNIRNSQCVNIYQVH